MKIEIGFGHSTEETSIAMRITDDVGRGSVLLLSPAEAERIADQLRLAVEKHADREAAIRGQS